MNLCHRNSACPLFAYRHHSPEHLQICRTKISKPHSPWENPLLDKENEASFTQVGQFWTLSMPGNVGATSPHTKNQDTLMLTQFYFCFPTCQDPNSEPDLHKIFKLYTEPQFFVNTVQKLLHGPVWKRSGAGAWLKITSPKERPETRQPISFLCFLSNCIFLFYYVSQVLNK